MQDRATNRHRGRNPRPRDEPHGDPGPTAEPERDDITNAELIVLGAMMLSAAVIDDVLDEIHSSDDFRNPRHATIYSAIIGAAAAGHPTEPVALARQLADAAELGRVGGAAYLHTLIESVPTTANAAYYAGLVAAAGRQRRSLTASAALEQAIRSGNPSRIAHALTEVNRHVGAPTRPASMTDLLHPGGAFILDVPDTVPAIWGQGDDVLWAEGESLIIAGPSGVGKTTITGQLLRARLGLADKVLDLPVQAGKRVLYLAMDRPAQIRRALHRIFTPDERRILDERCVFWKGPPPHDLAKRPEVLLELARAADADTTIVDSVKDAAIGLSDDEVGASYNRARQAVLADGRQLLELHHMVKRGVGGAAPNTLADVYGSAHLVNGAGSVIVLWGSAGDPIVDFKHLKQPMHEVGPLKVLHESVTGMSSIWDGADLLELLRRCPAGVTASDAACVMYSTERPTPSEQEKARRRLERMVRQGVATFTGGGRGRGNNVRWFAAAPESWVPDGFGEDA